VRIHLGHHFYGAGNLGDDFMLAGFLQTIAKLVPTAAITGCVPFPLDPLRRRFPQIEWHEYTVEARTSCIRAADAWLGLGGSPFQAAQSRWFIDHLIGDLDLCHAVRRPMFFVGIGVQTPAELENPDVLRVCRAAHTIWTRDRVSAKRLSPIASTRVHAAADLSHALFRRSSLPSPARDSIGIVANCDYQAWPQLSGWVEALEILRPQKRFWIAQETRDLPGAERALFGSLPERLRSRWEMRDADEPECPLSDVIAEWPTPDLLVTCRYHAAIASAWAGAKVLVVEINEKLRSIARDLGVPAVAPTASTAELISAISQTHRAANLDHLAEAAERACRDFILAASTA